MKKTLIILVVSIIVLFTGVLYGVQKESEKAEAVTLENVYAPQFPGVMPEVTMDPMVGFPLF